MLKYLKTLYNFRDLLWMWTRREIKIRYKQSAIGGLWAILQPLSLMIVFTLVFSLLARVPTNGVPYPIFSYVALLPWTFLATSMAFAIPSLVNNMNLVTKIYFPREILPIASVGAALFDLSVASIVFISLLVIYKIRLTWVVLWIPLLLLVQILLTLGIVLFFSAVNVFYRDVRFVIPLITQLWLYATPIIYPVSLVPERFRDLYMLNPMAGLIDSYRRVILLGHLPDAGHLGPAVAISLVVCFIGYYYFKRIEWQFADII